MHGIAAFIVAMAFTTVASAQSPTNTNAVWGVNDQNQVFRWNFSKNGFVQIPGALKQVAVGTDGEVWGIDPGDTVHHWTGFQWEPLQTEKVTQISANVHELWGVNAVEDLLRWNGSAWEQLYRHTDSVSLGVIDGYPKRVQGVDYVSLAADGTRWGILGLYATPPEQDLPRVGSLVMPLSALLESGQQPSRLPLPPIPTRIWFVNENRGWAIDDTAQLFQWTGVRWQHVDGSYLDVAQAANGELWRLASDGTVLFSKNSSESPVQISASPLKQIALGPTGALDLGVTIEERQQILDAHNAERQNYPGVGALQWSTELESWAQDWAQTVASRGGTPSHRQDQRGNPFRPGEGLGENIFWWGPSRTATGVDAPVSWIAEKQWYNYEQDSCTPGKMCGHFTQVVWKTHQYVGCGKAISANDMAYYVCNYYPAGNTGGRPY